MWLGSFNSKSPTIELSLYIATLTWKFYLIGSISFLLDVKCFNPPAFGSNIAY